MSRALDKLYAVALRAGVNPTTGHALDVPDRPFLNAAQQAVCDAWGEYIKTRPKSENTLASANAFVAGWTQHSKYLAGG